MATANVPTKGDGKTTETAWLPDTSSLEQVGMVLKILRKKPVDKVGVKGGRPESWDIEYALRPQTRAEQLAAKATLTSAELQEAAKLLLGGK